jgi:hypothetical protein
MACRVFALMFASVACPNLNLLALQQYSKKFRRLLVEGKLLAKQPKNSCISLP